MKYTTIPGKKHLKKYFDCSTVALIFDRCSLILFFTLGILLITACSSDQGSNGSSKQGGKAAAPATMSEAAGVIDLYSFPLIDGAETPGYQNLAGVSYQAPLAVTKAFSFYQSKLTGQGWKEAPNSYVSDQTASGVFLKNGFVLSVTVMPGNGPDKSAVILQQHGNVDFAALPLGQNLKGIAVFPQTAIFSTTTGRDETANNIDKSLRAAGWVSYGFAGETKYYKQNAVRLSVTTSASPAQPGQIMINLESILLSADLPVPPDVTNPSYNDPQQKLTFLTQAPQEKLLEFYQSALPPLGWQRSMDKSVISDGQETFTYRNAAKDLLTVSFGKGPESSLEVTLELQTAAQLAAMNKRLDEQAAAYKAKQAK